MNVARSVEELESKPRAVALGTFDGVHLGHRRVLDAARAAGPTPTVVTFDPHPRVALGYGVELLAPLERRLELLGEAGIEETLVVDFDLELAQLEPEAFAERVLRPLGTEVVVAGANFRFGRGRAGDLELLRGLGFDARPCRSSRASLRPGSATCSAPARSTGRRGCSGGRPRWSEPSWQATRAAARSASRPRTCGRSPACSCPGYGIYAGAADGHRAAISIGTNPHYGGDERRIEAFLLDFAGDLYGKRLTLELWQRLRDEQAFESEAELVAQIARDVEATRQAQRPA